MASAKAVPAPRQIVLTLSEQEAETLRTILGQIGGMPDTSRRGQADAVRRALNDVGVENNQSDVMGSISFKESV